MTALFRGTVPAAGLVLDPGLVGSAEARRRVLALAESAGDLDLRLLPDGRWLAVLPEPVELRCEQAPGLVLVAADGGLTAPGLAGAPGAVRWPEHGAVRTVQRATLPRLPARDWLDLAGVPVHRLQPLDAPERAAVTPAELIRAEPDLRAVAGIGKPRWSRRRRSPTRPGLSSRVLVAGFAGSVALAVVAAQGAAWTGIWAMAVITLLAVLRLIPWIRAEAGEPALRPRRRRRARRRGLVRRPGPVRRWLTRLVTRAPGVVARRNERYLRALTAKFRRRDWNAALREAVALSTGPLGPDGWLSLRMPTPRRELRLRLGPPSGGATALTSTAHAFLRRLYAEAAQQLEAAGRIDEAVFVHAELLDDVPAALTLLERHGQLRLAAELAEARDRPAEQVVRLWWRAGERERAVTVARARGAFAAAVDRLTEADRPAAAELRRAWVDSCRRAGDPLGAIAAAWPAPELRATVLPDIAAALALGGAAAGTALAHRVAEQPSAESQRQVLELLGSRDTATLRSRTALIQALAVTPGRDAIADRRLCTAALRSAYRLEPSNLLRQGIRELARRADPLLAADLPVLPRPGPTEPVELTAPEADGQLPVRDAVTLPGQAILVACGEHGVRLLTADGRTRARWDVPADALVVADSGTVALLLRRAAELVTLDRLDLRTRRVTPGPLLRLRQVLPSFDGGTLIAVDGDGIVLLDVLADPPRVLWRELDREHRALRLARTPHRLTALVVAPPPLGLTEPLPQLWSWELPSMALRVRRNVELSPEAAEAVVHDDTLTMLTSEHGNPQLRSVRGFDRPVDWPVAPDALLRAGGAAFALLCQGGDGAWLASVDLPGRRDAVRAVFPALAGPIHLREHAGIVTLWDSTGRVLAAEPGGAGDLAAFATRL